jgi:hypothetical protein
MQIVNPHTVKVLCIILIASLGTVICSVVKDIFFGNSTSDWSMVAFLGFLIVPILIYFATITYCNRLGNDVRIENKKSKLIFFLVITIIGLLFSIIALLISAISFYDAIREGYFNLSDRSFFNLMLIFIDVVYVVFGPIVFFMQLQLRKQLLKKNETLIESLIDSIGANSNNSDD